ncbi:hypothetical protein NDU88_006239 [Pleurodeles waltl]|uniref:Uncharacterized protein n=1 Tax=Pleurodeles waltl TaxID=8319 RepID=A0AAV7RN96_PLEWA|nr:hypothetical protein NDU88_006239 [Pleurodeles waltl]
MLAQLMEQEDQQTPVLVIHNDDGALVVTQLAINGIFLCHLSKIYAAWTYGPDDRGAEYLAGVYRFRASKRKTVFLWTDQSLVKRFARQIKG